jgi:Phosphomannomutase
MSVFKAYDIRGIAGDELDVEFSERLGRAIATHLDAKSVSLVRDIRESSPSYHEAFVKGLRSAGADVIDLGISTTGVLYRSTVDLPVDVAVAITASHNPPEYNGFKICQGKNASGRRKTCKISEEPLRLVNSEGVMVLTSLWMTTRIPT